MLNPTDCHVIITAGGSGNRMGGSIPKQFQLINNKPILVHTLERFLPICQGTKVLVLSEQHFSIWQDILLSYPDMQAYTVVFGGSTRTQSVSNGLNHIPSFGFVAIHDGVRPLVSPTLIQRAFTEAAIHNSAIPSVPVVDSLRLIHSTGTSIVNRDDLRAIQTPQVFNTSMLKQAYRNAPPHISFTDDASIYEYSNYPLHLIDGEPHNLKITYPSDKLIAQSLLQSPSL